MHFQDDGWINLELLREADPNEPKQWISEKRYKVTHIPFPFDDEISGYESPNGLEKVDIMA